MDYATFLEQLSHVVYINAYKTFCSIEYIHNVTYKLFSLLL